MASTSKAPKSTARILATEPVWTPSMIERHRIAESIAQALYPWSKLEVEEAALDAIVGFPHTMKSKVPRGMFWSMALVFGDAGRDTFDVFFPHGGRRIQKIEWTAIMGATPVNTSEETFGRAVAFIEAARRLHVHEPIEERAHVREDLLDAAKHNRLLWLDLIEQARRGEHDLRLVDLGSGWTRVEDEEMTAALKTVLGRNCTSKSALA